MREKKTVSLFSSLASQHPVKKSQVDGPNAISKAVGYAKFYSRSHDAVIRVSDAAGDVIETQKQEAEFGKPWSNGIILRQASGPS